MLKVICRTRWNVDAVSVGEHYARVHPPYIGTLGLSEGSVGPCPLNSRGHPCHLDTCDQDAGPRSPVPASHGLPVGTSPRTHREPGRPRSQRLRLVLLGATERTYRPERGRAASQGPFGPSTTMAPGPRWI